MPDRVTVQTFDGNKYTIVKLTNLSDGTGETDVVKVNVSSLIGSPSRVAIESIKYSVYGMVVTLFWQATNSVPILELQGDGNLDFKDFGGLTNNAGSGVTGNITLSTTGHSLGDSYTIIMKLRK